MADLIDRQQAIYAAIQVVDDWDGWYDVECHRMITDALMELPSAQPECEDAVSRSWIRQDISDSIEQMTKIGIAVDGEWFWAKINDSLDNAPPVTPKLPECDDAVSREEVIGWARFWFEAVDINPNRFIAGVERLPSVTPKQKKGKWLPNPNDRTFDICSVCGRGTVKRVYGRHPDGTEWEEEENYSYCPRCGCAMEGAE